MVGIFFYHNIIMYNFIIDLGKMDTVDRTWSQLDLKSFRHRGNYK